MPRYYGSIDQGTTSTRFIIFDDQLRLVQESQKIEHKQITPHAGWLEHDPEEIFQNVWKCVAEAVESLRKRDSSFQRIEAIGVTNQRETTVAWDMQTKRPLYNAIVWSDVRTSETSEYLTRTIGKGNPRFAASICGLPCSTYFSGVKMRWMLDNVPAVRSAADKGTLAFGTIDTWVIWKLSGHTVFVTDVTNASRTMLMNIHSLQWDKKMCEDFGIPMRALPQICSCSEIYSNVRAPAELVRVLGEKVPLCGAIGDQQAALFGNMCFEPGLTKNTYGTGCFLLANVGTQVKESKNGLLSTVAYKIGKNGTCVYALEGSISGAGATIQWLRDRLKFFPHVADSAKMAASIPDTGDVYFVPAMGGLLCPYWDSKARGTIVGMSFQTTSAHITRAALEAIALQVVDVTNTMATDAQLELKAMKVDGGLTANRFLMEIQADYLGLPCDVPEMKETTALGAALCAALAVGIFTNLGDIVSRAKNASAFHRIEPRMSKKDREAKLLTWRRAVERSRNWAKL